MKNLRYLLIPMFLWLCQPTQATVFSYGALTSDDSTQIINDSLNNLQWLRWDVLPHLNYADTLTAISPSGSHPGWQIAHSAQAQMFINAIFHSGTPSCTTTDTTAAICGNVSASLGGLFGENFTNTHPYGYDEDFAFFLNDSLDYEVGYIKLYEVPATPESWVYESGWLSICGSDIYSQSGSDCGHEESYITWLLYRSAPPSTPEPTTLALLGLGLFGLAFKRKA